MTLGVAVPTTDAYESGPNWFATSIAVGRVRFGITQRGGAGRKRPSVLIERPRRRSGPRSRCDRSLRANLPRETGAHKHLVPALERRLVRAAGRAGDLDRDARVREHPYHPGVVEHLRVLIGEDGGWSGEPRAVVQHAVVSFVSVGCEKYTVSDPKKLWSEGRPSARPVALRALSRALRPLLPPFLLAP